MLERLTLMPSGGFSGKACLPGPHLPAGLPERPFAHRDDEPRLLGLGDELAGKDQAPASGGATG